jgi:hypothetical protein
MTSGLYNSRIMAQLHYTGNNGIGMHVTAAGLLWQGTWLDIRGEMLGAYTGCKRIENDGQLSAAGTFFIANTQPADDYSAGIYHQFIEDTLLESGNPAASLASAFVLTVPAGRDAFNVTGVDTVAVFAAETMWEARVFTLKFAAAATVQHTPGFIHLAGGANFVASANDTMTFAYIGGVAYEVSRSVNT